MKANPASICSLISCGLKSNLFTSAIIAQFCHLAAEFQNADSVCDADMMASLG
jgi:hypothetical protein